MACLRVWAVLGIRSEGRESFLGLATTQIAVLVASIQEETWAACEVMRMLAELVGSDRCLHAVLNRAQPVSTQRIAHPECPRT